MSDGRHCPECGEDIGYWAVAAGLFGIKCPHCRTRLRYDRSPRAEAVTNVVAIGAVLLGLGPAALVAWWAYLAAGPLAAFPAAVAAWLGAAWGVGFLFEVATANYMRRTQRLVVRGGRDEPEEETW
jgi:hypothetical protein